MATGTHGDMEKIAEFERWFAPFSYKATIKVKENQMVRNETVKEMSVAPTKRPGSFIWKVNTEAGSKYQFFATTSDKDKTILAAVEPGTQGLFVFTEEEYLDQFQQPRTSKVLQGVQDPSVDVNADVTPPPTSAPPPPQNTWGTPAPTASTTPKAKVLDGMTLCNVTNNGSMIFCEYIKNANTLAEVDNDVLINLFNTIADWHRKNVG